MEEEEEEEQYNYEEEEEEEEEEGVKIFKDYIHEHELRLVEQYREFAHCIVCKQKISEEGPYYFCNLCYEEAYIHKSLCSELVDYIQHPLHRHNLRLSSEPVTDDFCSACGDNCHGGFMYKCFECPKFKLDIKCAMLTRTGQLSDQDKRQSHNEIHRTVQLSDQDKRQSHNKILELVSCHMSNGFSYTCCCCHLPISNIDGGGSLVHVCLQCRGLLHESCADLPQVTEHLFHPSHFLYVISMEMGSSSMKGFKCNVCWRDGNALGYNCPECQFFIDIPCVSLQKHTKENYQLARQFRHSHPLTLYDNIRKFPIPCCGCGLPLGDSICYCPECKILLHELCADLPPQVTNHVLHPEHTLTLCDYRDGQSCRACLWSSHGFFYKCSQCEFHLDVRCALLSEPTVVMSRLHIHPLVVLRNDYIGTDAKCLFCDIELDNMTPILRCVWCNCNWHLNCSFYYFDNFPPTINSRHCHPLTLTYERVTDYPHEGFDAELYCDACEKRRDIEEVSYYCEKCNYVAHLRCVLSEIVQHLEEEWSRHDDDGRQRMKLKGFVDSFREKDDAQVESIFDIKISSYKEADHKTSSSEEGDGDSLKLCFPFNGLRVHTLVNKVAMYDLALHYYMHLDKLTAQMMRMIVLENEFTIPWKTWDLTSTVVRYVNFVVFENQVPIVEALFSKYGEFTMNSSLYPNVKKLLLMTVCDCIHSMCSTKIGDVTTDLLLNWFYSFAISRYYGFEMNFAFHYLVKVVRAHFGLQVGGDPVYPSILSGLDREEEITKQHSAIIETKDLLGSVDQDRGRESSDGLQKKLDSVQLIITELDGGIQELDGGIEEIEKQKMELEKKKMELVKTHEEMCTRKEWLIDAIEVDRQMACLSLLQ